MPEQERPIVFVTASTLQGTMIVSRLDYRALDSGQAYGVGFQLLSRSSYHPEEIALVTMLLDKRRRYFGDGVRALDIGANIGIFTVAWARHMTGWGAVLAIEAQERVFYALAGNIAVNNCFNARALWAAATARPGTMRVPVPNYMVPASLGSLELRRSERNEDIGQPIDYSEERMALVTAVSVDSLSLPRLDLMKVDVEAMEMEVLEGARRTIETHRPILVVEKMKAERDALHGYLDSFGYKYFAVGMNLVAVHPSDPCIEVSQDPPGLAG